ncbi:hypothetical protein [Fontivita pretiosa]
MPTTGASRQAFQSSRGRFACHISDQASHTHAPQGTNQPARRRSSGGA